MGLPSRHSVIFSRVCIDSGMHAVTHCVLSGTVSKLAEGYRLQTQYYNSVIEVTHCAALTIIAETMGEPV